MYDDEYWSYMTRTITRSFENSCPLREHCRYRDYVHAPGLHGRQRHSRSSWYNLYPANNTLLSALNVANTCIKKARDVCSADCDRGGAADCSQLHSELGRHDRRQQNMAQSSVLLLNSALRHNRRPCQDHRMNSWLFSVIEEFSWLILAPRMTQVPFRSHCARRRPPQDHRTPH